ncbi:MAG: redoxin domain-containing protein [Deltaproteobacteria bacterium]|nr:redoxin domain-containing protein [Deltaproteobacteria bacterium]
MIRAAVLAVLLVGCGSAASAPEPGGVAVGKAAPAWELDWMGAPPIAVKDLRGSVVLVRWFTEGCSLCSSSAPTLVALHDELGAKGLRVIGVYHHKSPESLEVANVRALAAELGFKFPIAIDRDWKTLKAWWLDGGAKRFTSVSFVIDRRGAVRYIHEGGAYAPKSKDAAELRRWIDRLLHEDGAQR